MVKLVRHALTAAILTAIVVRLRRRARTPSAQDTAGEEDSERTGDAEGAGKSLRRWMVAGVAIAVLAGGSLVLDRWAFDKGPQWEGPPTYVVEAESLQAEELFRALRRDGEPGDEPSSETPDDPACRPARRAPAVRPIDPRVKRAVDRQWRRIERWLSVNAPTSHRELGSPGRAGTIAVAESQMGLRFPDDLRASLLRHNGGFPLPGHETEDIRGIRDTWRYLCEGDDFDAAAGPRVEAWDGRMIPLGPDGSGGYLVLDSVKGDLGTTVEASPMHFTGEPWARSFHALLRAIADALESGEPVDGERPAVISGELVWEYVG
ncbi:SMI1/KNR4 family protein [Nonomuraea sp. NPDC049152]|uniref:SMI1/KNR4 family protein n=1 Tax=Nonomuraea sp. NPDC049152 TaxID=3154350 RepID=UPI0033FCC3FF